MTCGIWVNNHSGSEESVQIGCLAFRSQFRSFHKSYHSLFPDRNLTRVHDITPAMVGTKADKKLKTKGAETWGVLLFLQSIFEKYGDEIIAGDIFDISPEEYLAAARSLIAMCTIMDEGKCNLSEAGSEQLMFQWKRFVSITSHLPALDLPKKHATSHMVAKSKFFGNPRYFSCWFDEALNKTLKQVCRCRSQITFEQAVLCAMPDVLRRRIAKRQQRW